MRLLHHDDETGGADDIGEGELRYMAGDIDAAPSGGGNGMAR